MRNNTDAKVRGAVELVFRLFHETGSAYAVVQRFVKAGLRFPKRAYGGAWDGKLVSGRLSHGRFIGILKNPAYAGAYVFGRYQYRRALSPDGEIHTKMRCDLLDTAISEQVLTALQPSELKLTLAALDELEARDAALTRLQQLRPENAVTY